jgi:hypothetical protein
MQAVLQLAHAALGLELCCILRECGVEALHRGVVIVQNLVAVHNAQALQLSDGTEQQRLSCAEDSLFSTFSPLFRTGTEGASPQ